MSLKRNFIFDLLVTKFGQFWWKSHRNQLTESTRAKSQKLIQIFVEKKSFNFFPRIKNGKPANEKLTSTYQSYHVLCVQGYTS